MSKTPKEGKKMVLEARMVDFEGIKCKFVLCQISNYDHAQGSVIASFLVAS
jgi:hypothetical protein